MPKSRVRRKAVYIPPPRTAKARPSPGWLAPTMVGCLLVGLAWIVVYYVTNAGVPPLSSMGAWNMVVGFGLIVVGLALATRWR